jgi:glyoxylase-like metal-dependent hydrolase (beta-lactamase superfamily II)
MSEFIIDAVHGNPGLRRLGTKAVNYYLLEVDGRFTLFDAGYPGYFDGLVQALTELKTDLSAIEAVVLTHAHPDHMGMAERIRTEGGARVLVHEADAGAAMGTEVIPSERPATDYLEEWPQAALTFGHAMENGAMETPPIGAVETFVDGAELDVPGNPLVISSPGHTPGQCSLLLGTSKALIVGDTLEGFNPLTGRYGPQVGPVGTNTDTEQALQSLERLERVEAEAVLFGHGDPWIWGVSAAVASARALGRS